MIALGIALSIVDGRDHPVLGWMTLLIWPVIGLAGLGAVGHHLIKANQVQKVKLPFVGDLAEKQAAAV